MDRPGFPFDNKILLLDFQGVTSDTIDTLQTNRAHPFHWVVKYSQSHC